MKNVIFKLNLILIVFIIFGCKKSAEKMSSPPHNSPKTSQQKTITADEFGTIDAAVDSLLRATVEEGGAPSISAGIVVNDSLVWAKNYNGIAGLQTAYGVGSITKPFTATAILQLYEQGLLDLDDDVNKYLPFSVRHPKFPDRPITIRMLLTHQSGLDKETVNFDIYTLMRDSSLRAFAKACGTELPKIEPWPKVNDFFEGLLTPKGAYYTRHVWIQEPGQLQYSNIGFSLLAQIVEKIADKSYEKYVKEHILEPLGMINSGFNPSQLAETHAPPCARIIGKYYRTPDRRKKQIPGSMRKYIENNIIEYPVYEVLPGFVGLSTTVPDLSEFMIAHMNNGRAPNRFQLLKPETVELMHQVGTPCSDEIDIFKLKGQGMGWAVGRNGIHGHIGGQFGYLAAMIYREAETGKAGFILMINQTMRMVPDQDIVMEWGRKYYLKLEALLLKTADRMLGKS
ncbi:MAG: serine hydrolase domain-containing protein [Candidatus Hodarchaeota archaeon]